MVKSMREQMRGFIGFVRKQGVVGLAVGFVLGGAVSKVVTALVTDIINPLLSVVLGVSDGLRTAKLTIGTADILWGDFLSVMIDFLAIAFVVYYAVKLLGIEEAEKKVKIAK